MSPAAAPATPRRGRPRDPSRDRALIAAAREVIAQRGVTGATMEDIARTAGAGKDTLYRRWGSKDGLVIDVIDSMALDAVRPTALEPDPRLNLLLYLKDIVRLNQHTDFGAIIAGVVGASSRDPVLAVSFRAFWARRRTVASAIVREVVGDGVGDDELCVLLDRLLAPIYYRLLLTGDEIDDEYLWNLIVDLPSDDTPPDLPPPPGATAP